MAARSASLLARLTVMHPILRLRPCLIHRLPLAAILLAAHLLPACALKDEGVFGPVVRVDAPWRAPLDGDATYPLVLNVTRADEFPIYLESLALWKIHPTQSVNIEFMDHNAPDYVVLFRRDHGEHLDFRPTESDSFRIDSEFLEINLTAEPTSFSRKGTSLRRDPSAQSFRIFERCDTNSSPPLPPSPEPTYLESHTLGYFPLLFLKLGSLGLKSLLLALDAGDTLIGRPLAGVGGYRSHPGTHFVDRLAVVPTNPLQPTRVSVEDKEDNCHSYRLLDPAEGFDLSGLMEPGQTHYWLAATGYTNRMGGYRIKDLFLLPSRVLAGLSAWGRSLFSANRQLRFWRPWAAGSRDFHNALTPPLFVQKVLRVQNRSLASDRPTSPARWLAGDTHVHTRYSHNPAEGGHGLKSTRDAATAIGLDWLTVTDHASDQGNMDVNSDDFADQRRQIGRLNADLLNAKSIDPAVSLDRTLLIHGQEIAVTRKYDPGQGYYHLLVYQTGDPEFISGRIRAPDPVFGPSQFLRVLSQRNPQGAPTQDLEEIVGYLGHDDVAFIAHPREQYDARGLAKEYSRWEYEDFARALAEVNVRGLELWNTDESAGLTIQNLWRAHTVDFNRASHLQLPNAVLFSQLLVLNLAISPIHWCVKQFGISRAPTLWWISPQYDSLVDPRKGIDRPDTRHVEGLDLKDRFGTVLATIGAPSHQSPGKQAGADLTQSGSPWALGSIIDNLGPFPYTIFASSIAAVGEVSTFQSWIHKRPSNGLAHHASDIFSSSFRFLFGLFHDCRFTIEKAYFEQSLSDRFWARRIPDLEAWNDTNIKNDALMAASNARRAFDASPMAHIDDLPTLAPVVLDYDLESDWEKVRKSLPVKRWVELHSGLDLWDYGLHRRMDAILWDLQSGLLTSDNLAFNSDHLTHNHLEALNGHSPLGRLRLTALAGSDAHGDFNYHESNLSRFNHAVSNMALGSVRTSLRIPPSALPETGHDPLTVNSHQRLRLAAMAAGAAVLTNGPHADFVLHTGDGDWPLGSSVPLDFGSLDQAHLELNFPDNSSGASNVRLFVGLLDGTPTGGTRRYFGQYDTCFRADSRRTNELFNALSRWEYRHAYNYIQGTLATAEKQRQINDYFSQLYPLDPTSNTERVERALSPLYDRIQSNRALIPSLYTLPYPEADNIPLLAVLQTAGLTPVQDRAGPYIGYIRLEYDSYTPPASGHTDQLPADFLEERTCITNPIWFTIH